MVFEYTEKLPLRCFASEEVDITDIMCRLYKELQKYNLAKIATCADATEVRCTVQIDDCETHPHYDDDEAAYWLIPRQYNERVMREVRKRVQAFAEREGVILDLQG